jgi:hypothetical protein
MIAQRDRRWLRPLREIRRYARSPALDAQPAPPADLNIMRLEQALWLSGIADDQRAREWRSGRCQ